MCVIDQVIDQIESTVGGLGVRLYILYILKVYRSPSPPPSSQAFRVFWFTRLRREQSEYLLSELSAEAAVSQPVWHAGIKDNCKD